MGCKGTRGSLGGATVERGRQPSATLAKRRRGPDFAQGPCGTRVPGPIPIPRHTPCPDPVGVPTLSRLVWTEGMHLAQHHFQAQCRYFESAMHFALSSVVQGIDGFVAVDLDHDALWNGTVSLVRASGVMPDGLVFDLGRFGPTPRHTRGLRPARRGRRGRDPPSGDPLVSCQPRELRPGRRARRRDATVPGDDGVPLRRDHGDRRAADPGGTPEPGDPRGVRAPGGPRQPPPGEGEARTGVATSSTTRSSCPRRCASERAHASPRSWRG